MTALTKESDFTGSGYDVERIRTDFPILFREVYGKPLIYLDNAASAQKPSSGASARPWSVRKRSTPSRRAAMLSTTSTAMFVSRKRKMRFKGGGLLRPDAGRLSGA